MKISRALCAVALLIVVATPATAQTAARRRVVKPSRFFVTVNGGAQPANSDLSERFDFERNLETATVDVSYPSKTGVLIDGGGGARLWRQFGAGVAVSYVSTTGSANIDARIPHPFVFGQPRTVSGAQDSINRAETGVHVQALYFVPTKGKLRAVVSAGPSVISLSHDIVTDVHYGETYPYDAATFSRATTKTVTGSGVGFNVGLDVQWTFMRQLGAGALLRFTRAQADLDVEPGRSFSVDTGGVQAGAGIRVLF